MKMKMKMIIDFLMSLLLLFLMTYQVVGEELHEWFGAALLVLFIIHTLLNIKWYTALFKGKYTLMRAVSTVLNFAVLINILCLGYSGIVMSRYVFDFLDIREGMALARVMHLAASYWGFMLMSFHLGLHWGLISGMFKKALGITRVHKAVKIVSGVFVLAVSLYGVQSFISERIASNMFLETQFVFFDFDAPALGVIGKYAAMMVLFVTIAALCAALMKKIKRRKKQK